PKPAPLCRGILEWVATGGVRASADMGRAYRNAARPHVGEWRRPAGTLTTPISCLHRIPRPTDRSGRKFDAGRMQIQARIQAAQRNPVANFRDFVRNPAHPCAMAKSVLAHEAVEFGTYRGLGSQQAAQAMCVDLYRSLAGMHDGYWSFVALFPDELVSGEEQFEDRLWKHLQRMHDFDAPLHPWDGTVSDDPEDPCFSFSIGGRAWYVIGLHPRASRKARRLDTVALVFNPHAQFNALRSRDKYGTVRDQIRQRDLRLQGSINPMLADYGESSEARQYSGRAVGASWKCPFRAAPAAD